MHLTLGVLLFSCGFNTSQGKLRCLLNKSLKQSLQYCKAIFFWKQNSPPKLAISMNLRELFTVSEM